MSLTPLLLGLAQYNDCTVFHHGELHHGESCGVLIWFCSSFMDQCVRWCRRGKRNQFDPWVRKTPGGGHGNPLQYSCLESPLDRGAWWLTVHRVAQSRIQLKILGTHAHTPTVLTTSWAGLALGTCVASDGAGWEQEVSRIQGVEAKVWLWPWVDLSSRSVYPLW